MTVEDAIHVANELAKKGAPFTVVTMSELGAVYVDPRTATSGHVGTKKVKVVDSTGAGDSFFSAGCRTDGLEAGRRGTTAWNESCRTSHCIDGKRTDSGNA